MNQGKKRLLRGLRGKLLITASLIAAVFALQYAAAQNSGSRIDLNTPVSFPVDI